MLAPIVGHVGDGNFHCMLFLDPIQRPSFALPHEFGERLARRAQDMGGTCTGEHGIGIGKGKYMAAEVGETGMATMRAIKDPLRP